ncbi:unnamed protein product [Brassica oleracea]|uniref:proline--tRNA ligase n=1 Tax=Brassica napus TaxID=3708 RepID=A0A816QCP3_BRANA|nr:unnamed protein product [Brassica napus]
MRPNTWRDISGCSSVRKLAKKEERVGMAGPSGKKEKVDKAGPSGGGKKKKDVKKETGLGLSVKKDENFGEWYSEVCKHEMIEYYDISGCYILRPWSMAIWEIMQTFFDAEIKKMKVKNCYFPLFVSPGVLEKEKDHIEGFAPEVAWVTKSGKSDLEVPIAIRPTSETVMYPYYSKWIRGHRDLPLKLNQWCNVVRWEFSNPTPFIRSREFLWQEGHTAFATKEEADEEVLQILELYRRIYEEYLAVPVVKGMKSENEKFAGGLYTTSVEAFIPNTGRGVQGATSHCLGQNFAKMFEIRYEDEEGKREMVWQNSWAYSTRTIGVMIMTHGDDKGLILPPKVASVQVVVIPVPYKDANTQGIFDACTATVSALSEAGIRAEEDLRDNYSPGWKYSNWEMKGVPLRIEIGPRDLENDQVRTVRRDNGVKEDIPRGSLVEHVKELLEKIQQNMYEVARQKREACVQEIRTWDEFISALNQKKLILAPWCDEEEVERDVKARTKGETGAAKTLCSPFEQPELPEELLEGEKMRSPFHFFCPKTSFVTSGFIVLKKVCRCGEMMAYYDISECYILRPNAMKIWNIMRTYFDAVLEKAEVDENYFPLFVSASVLEKEKDHVQGFAPEVCVKWIKSHRDLPLELNQWNNVVRWESREFLWQEGHTAHATEEEADKEVLEVLDHYRHLYEEYLVVPVVKGMKSENEKFAGARYTTSVEAFIPETGRGIQGATSHCLGTKFAKMFDIEFTNKEGKNELVWQKEKNLETFVLAHEIMTHGDDKGLVNPPKVAPIQVIVIPVPFKDADTKEISKACSAVKDALREAGIRAKEDLSDNYSPKWKYSHWEIKGVPLRIEIGPRDLAKKQVRTVRRDNGVKADVPRVGLVEHVKELLGKIQQNMFDVAKQKRDDACVVVKTWDEFVEALGQKKLILAPWSDEEEVEMDVKRRTKDEVGAAKTLCSPFDQPEIPEVIKTGRSLCERERENSGMCSWYKHSSMVLGIVLVEACIVNIQTRDVLVKNLTILAPLDSPNTDGVDPDSSTNVCIEDCYIVTGDDLVSIKSGWDEYGISYARPSSKIKINRVTGQTTSSSGIAIGSEMSGGVSDIYIKDLHLFNSNTGIRIKTSPGRGGYVRNVHVSNVKFHNVQKAIRFTGKYGEHPDENFDPKALPVIEKITFENVNGEGIGVAGLLEGIEGDEFKNICFLNVTLIVKKNSKKAPWKCSHVRGYSQWVSPEITCDSFGENIFPEHSSDCFGLSENDLEKSSGLSRSPWLLSW